MWETLAHDVEPEQLVNRVIDAHNQDDKEAVESYLCGKFFWLLGRERLWKITGLEHS